MSHPTKARIAPVLLFPMCVHAKRCFARQFPPSFGALGPLGMSSYTMCKFGCVGLGFGWLGTSTDVI